MVCLIIFRTISQFMDTDVDLRKLERQFINAKSSDAKQREENSAKFRAIHQKVETYEEFCDIVAASHLKPYNDQCTKTNQNTARNKTLISDKLTFQCLWQDGNKEKTCNEFVKIWRNLKDSKSKCGFLFNSVETGNFKNLFLNDLPVIVFEESIDLMLTMLSDENINYFACVLEAFSRSSRFHLCVKFLDKRTKKQLHDLLNKFECAFSGTVHEVFECALK